MIITIDGPAGAGKSTAARQLAKALDIAFLDTGATYRAATLAALRAGTDLEDEAALAQLVGGCDIRLEYEGDDLHVLLDGEDVSAEIRTAEVSDNSHFIASAPGVRKVLVALQRQIGGQLADAAGGAVSEGRDQGSVVFPDADIKFFLQADPEIRARRRHAELADRGEQAELEDVLNGIITRDDRDSNRAIDPLIRPEGAVVVDTSHNEIADTAAELIRQVEMRR